MSKIEKTRREYSEAAEIGAAASPIALFRAWYAEAAESEIIEPNAMSLATVDTDGKPSLRMVLLKGIEQDSFRFYTSYLSRKAEDITANRNVALCLYWDVFERQVRIEGPVEKLGADESDRYFSERPRGAQLGAWASNQSAEVGDYSLLVAEKLARETKFEGAAVPRPDFWGGYRVLPKRIEFWQGSKNRLHRRREYLRDGDSWMQRLLQP